MPAELDDLTLAQRELVCHRGAPLLLVGAAGTGKTVALVRRHAWLATAGGLAPEHQTEDQGRTRSAAPN